MKKHIFKKIQTFNAVLTVFVLLASFYFQYVMGLVPCPLCLMQRVCVFLLLAIISVSIRNLNKARIISLFQIVIACAGLFFSLRQLWLQSLPVGQAPACMPSLNILMDYFPWQTVLKTLFLGSRDCAEVNWRLLGVSMPGWSTLYFSFIAMMGYFLFWRTQSSLFPKD